MIPIEGHKDLYRDENSGAIINNNISEYNSYMKLKKQKHNEQNELDLLRSELNEIKTLLKELLK
jgi:DNA-nicking Smr family endonuclease